MMKERVSWEIVTSSSKAQLTRLMQALIACDGHMLGHYMMGEPPHGTLMVIVAVAPENIERFKAMAKVDEITYRSPTWFNNGSITPMYRTPEEQLEGQRAERALLDVGQPEALLRLVLGTKSEDGWDAPVAVARVVWSNDRNKHELLTQRVSAWHAPNGAAAVVAFQAVLSEVSQDLHVWLAKHIARRQ